jgi:hypothetical protein
MAQLHESPTEASDYAAINAVWAGLLGGVLLSSREAEAPSGAELPVLSLATFALSKAIAKEKVGSWVREPVVDHSTPDLKPKGRGLRYAVGELLTCSRCLGTWGSLGLVGLRVLRPREGRIVATVLATAGINDWLQAGFNFTTSRANVEQAVAQEPERFVRAPGV